MSRVAIVGAGIFGVTAAIELRRRGHDVALFDPGPIPHPLAESTDISKIVRLDYGADEAYLTLGAASIEGFRRWNAAWGETLFHEGGVLFVTRSPMAPGGFEHETYARLVRDGRSVTRLDARAIRARFPAYATGAYVDGYYNPVGGYAESGRVVERLVADAVAAGVEVHAGVEIAALDELRSRVVGLVTSDTARVAADKVIVAAGAWTQRLVPALAPHLRATGQPVFHLAPADPRSFEAARFPVFGADIARTGYYGFPVTRDGRVKIANHGVGRTLDPAGPRAVTADDEASLRAFLKETFPSLLDAPIVYTRLCVYSDTWDGHFWIAPDPTRDGLVVAAGGSGHGFKFAPVLGGLIADATEGVANPMLARFRWRDDLGPRPSEEAARRKDGAAHERA